MNTQKNNEKRIVLTRNFLIWVENKIKHYINLSPKLLDFSASLRKHDSDIKTLDNNYQIAIEKLKKVDATLIELTQEIRQFNESIRTIREHISSVDEKAASIEKLRSMIYAIWDVQIQTTEPKIKDAEMLVESYRHLLNVGPEKRSKVTNENISGLFKKRWTDMNI